MDNHLDSNSTQQKINSLASEKKPFLFIVNFELDKNYVFELDAIPEGIHFSLEHLQHCPYASTLPNDISFSKGSIPIEDYKIGFDLVKKEINYGNSFLLNLTYPSPIQTNLNLKQIFDFSHAKYKLFIQNELVVFSPESFIKINDGIITSFPMKGTIDASIEDAENKILSDPKELAEHFTIVDLIRNDLSQVAKKVTVEKFRYVEKITSKQKELLQVSSKISGELPENYYNNLGDILFSLLPAGSISGAPKKKTLEIINAAERKRRNYYTGVFGVFDGKNLDSGVMIRCIQKNNDQLNYHSGGGITHLSNLDEEYQELLDKVYVPIIRNDQNSERRNKKSRVSQ